MFFDFQLFFQLILAAFLGCFIGLEREIRKKEAGMRTYSLVCLGSALFSILAFEIFNQLNSNPGISFDPSRVIQAVAVGIGFLGAGIIIFREQHVEGLTTAAGLWVVAAIGVAIGSGFYFIAISTALIAMVILSILRITEEKFLNK